MTFGGRDNRSHGRVSGYVDDSSQHVEDSIHGPGSSGVGGINTVTPQLALQLNSASGAVLTRTARPSGHTLIRSVSISHPAARMRAAMATTRPRAAVQRVSLIDSFTLFSEPGSFNVNDSAERFGPTPPDLARPTRSWHAAFLLESGEHTLVIDPFLTDNPLATKDPDDFEATYIALTHGHADHWGNTVAIA